MTARAVLLTIGLGVITACVPPRSPQRGVAGLDRYVASFGTVWGDPAAFHGYVAVARGGTIEFGKGYGAAAPTADTLFRIGSISKTFTAVSILQLEEQGRLRLDDPVRRYLPELSATADSVTIRHCLAHSSGLPPVPDSAALAVENGKSHPLSALAGYPDKPLEFTPGEKFEYANAGFIVLGAILERVSGESYEAYLREHVFRPAGMMETTTVSDPPPARLAVGYHVDYADKIEKAASVSPMVSLGCGSVLSSANDLVAWDRALAGTRLLSESSKRRMFTPGRDTGAMAPGRGRMGLAWFIAENEGHESHWHGGGMPGFLSSFTSIPDAGITVIVLGNYFSSYELEEKISAAAEKMALGGPNPAPLLERVPQPIGASPLEGEYRADGPTLDRLRANFPAWAADRWAGVALVARDGHLFVHWTGEGDVEVFRGADGAFFTKQGGLELVAEPGAVAILKKTGVDKRYVRLSNTFDGPSRCPSGMTGLGTICMDTTEVTVGAYAHCVRAGRCDSVPTTVLFEGLTAELGAKWNPMCNGVRKDRLDHPVNCVDWAAANTYCAAQGKRLPTEVEWEWAARGGDEARKFPWGFRDPEDQLCWSGRETRNGTCPVSSFVNGDGRGGVHDLAGNVGEWTSTAAENGYVVKAAGFNVSNADGALCAAREPTAPTFRGPSVGFRCVSGL